MNLLMAENAQLRNEVEALKEKVLNLESNPTSSDRILHEIFDHEKRSANLIA